MVTDLKRWGLSGLELRHAVRAMSERLDALDRTHSVFVSDHHDELMRYAIEISVGAASRKAKIEFFGDMAGALGDLADQGFDVGARLPDG